MEGSLEVVLYGFAAGVFVSQSDSSQRNYFCGVCLSGKDALPGDSAQAFHYIVLAVLDSFGRDNFSG
jgi:hypothetical protein